MLVRMAFGLKAGHVVDMLPHEARAMLADGRASLPESAAPDPAVIVDRVAAREDRVPHRVKHRRTR